MSMRRLLHDPLLQFVVLGLVFFALYLVARDETVEEDRQIVVSVRQIEQLSALWQSQWRRPPTETELAGLVESHVREEVLYREAKSLGLDRDDLVVRRRLAQKIEFLAQDLATQGEPSDAELETFFQEHPDLFRVPPKVSFVHVYVSRDARGAAADADAEAILETLRAGAEPSEQGDRFMLQRQYLRKRPDEVARHFGSRFADEVIELPRGKWVGPVESGYGIHLVFVESLEEAYLPDYADVKEDIRNEYMSFRRREVDELFYSKLREGYEVVIEDPSEEPESIAEVG
jgi:peptidyl-prolyl cis-trans isomerase C